MAHMDVFNDDAFNTITLSAAFERIPHKPSLLGSIPGLFDPVPVRSKTISIEQRNGTFALIQTSERGAPLQERANEKRDIRPFNTRRIAEGDTVNAAEIAAIRAFGSETELMQVMAEVARRFDGPTGIQRQIELTQENMRLGAIRGIVKDADGSVLDNWYTNWGIAQAAEVDFALGTATTKVRGKCMTVRRQMRMAAKGSWVEGVTQVHALAGDAFFDALIDHELVRDSYLGWVAAADLRGALDYDVFYFGGIYWHNYRGADTFDKDATAGMAALGVDPDKAVFFPTSAPGVFQHIQAPADEFIPYVGSLGQNVYGMTIPDRDRQAWVRVEAYSYPLFICTNPGMLQRAKRA